MKIHTLDDFDSDAKKIVLCHECGFAWLEERHVPSCKCFNCENGLTQDCPWCRIADMEQRGSLEELWRHARSYGRLTVSEGDKQTTASIGSTHIIGSDPRDALQKLITRMNDS